MDKKADEAVDHTDNESKEDYSEHGAARPVTSQGDTEIQNGHDKKTWKKPLNL
jgi:hypothetical protein